jgi:quinoprotein glucose dehydrogenase
VAVLALGAWISVAAASQQPPPTTVWSGVYTEEQATRGEELYSGYCADCHGDDLAGIEQAPALAGSAFGEKWNKADLRKLYELVEAMPPRKPKSLTAKQYTDILSYLLFANEMPAGTTPLESDRGALAAITFTTVRPQP